MDLLRRLHKQVVAFRRDERGTVAIIFAFSILITSVAVGLAIDASRAYHISSKVANALDSAALAGAKLLDDANASDTEVQATAKRYFEAQLTRLGVEGVVISNFRATPNRASSTVTVSADVAVAATIGQLASIPTFEFSRDAAVTYRMRRVELAMVLDVTGSMANNGKIDSLKLAAKDVIEILRPQALTPTAIRIALAPYSAAVNAGPYAGTVSGGASVDNCVFERNGSAAYSEDPPVSGRYLGAEPTPATPSNPQYGCPAAVVQPLTNDWTLLRNTIDSYAPLGWTAGHIGAAWGWYLVSPAWASTFPSASAPSAYSDPNVIKAVILMTDGEFNTSYLGGGINSTDPSVNDSSPFQALRLCDNMKAQGITIYAVAFESPPLAEETLRRCSSGSGTFFSASNGTELRAAFQEIANRLNSLRITR